LSLEQLETRCLLTVAVNEFGFLTANSQPLGIAAGEENNLWFTESNANRVAHLTTNGTVTEYLIPTPNSQPYAIAAGDERNFWFTERLGNKIGRVTPPGVITEIVIPTPNSQPAGIAAGDDDGVWFTEIAANKIGRINEQGHITEFVIPTANSQPIGITRGDGNSVWFTESAANKIGRLDEHGHITEFTIPTANSRPVGITRGDGNTVWFTENGANKIGRLEAHDDHSSITEIAIPTANSQPVGITRGDGDTVWFTESGANKIGQIDQHGEHSSVSETVIPTANSQPSGIVRGPDNSVWFTETQSNLVANVVPRAILAAAGTIPHATEGAAFTGVVASFTTDRRMARASDFTATITWGKGHTAPGTITANGSGGFNVSGPNTYAEEGAYEIRVDVTTHREDDDPDMDVDGFVATAHSVAQVADAPLVPTGLNLQTANGVTFSGTVATFADAGGPEAVGNYTASIDWGDGSAATPGTVTVAGSTFQVAGTHPYANGGFYNTRVTVKDEGGSVAAGAGRASVLAVVIDNPLAAVVVRQNLTVTGHLTGDISAVGSLTAQVDGGASVNVAFDAAGHFSYTTTLPLNHSADGNHTVGLRATDKAGDVTKLATASFQLNTVVGVTSIAPANGEDNVDLTRPTVVNFSGPINPATVTTDSFYLIANGSRVPGSIRVSSTNLFATFFYTNALPPSTEVRVVADGAKIKDSFGQAVSGSGSLDPGGKGTADFRTLPLTRIHGTNLFGYVYDAYNKKPDGSNIPIVGATIRVDAFPSANAVTDANGYFILKDMPAPEFFVHVDGTTAINAPAGTMYPSVGKAFHDLPGQTVQLNMSGVPFNVYLPPMSMGDVKPLSPTASTDVGFGAGGKAELAAMFPTIDPATWDRLKVTFAPNAATDNNGKAATQAAIIPVPPNRLPAPLPPGQNPKLVISIQALGATRFDVPAPITYPNIEGLKPGQQALIWSFNHEAARWDVIGTGTVSADGTVITSDPGVGIKAPGWHFIISGSLERDVANRYAIGSKADYNNPALLKSEYPILDANSITAAAAAKADQIELQGIAATWSLAQPTASTFLSHFLSNSGGDITEPDGSQASNELKNDANFIKENMDVMQRLKQAIKAQLPSGNVDFSVAVALTNGDVFSTRDAGVLSDLYLAFGTLEGLKLSGDGNISGANNNIASGTLTYEYSTIYGFSLRDTDAGFPFGPIQADARFLQLDGLAKPFIASVQVTMPFSFDLSTDPTVGTLPAPAISTVPGFGNDPSVYYRFVLDNGFEIAGKTDAQGHLNNVVLPRDTNYRVVFYAPSTNRWTSFIGTSGDSGQIFGVAGAPSTLDLTNFGGVDSTGDGLPDIARYVLGLKVGVRSFAGDGIDDATKLTMGLDLFDGRAFPTGVISTVPLQGNAEKVLAEGNQLYVATGSNGLAIVDGTQFNNPIVLGQLQLGGYATDVGVDPNLQVAAVATGSALQLVNVADPMTPTLNRSVAVGATRVVVANGLAYAVAGRTLDEIDLLTGEVEQSLTLPGFGNVTGIARDGTKLYAYDRSSSTFMVIDISNEAQAAVLGQLSVSIASSDVGVFAANGVAWLAGSGLRTVNVSDPAHPVLIHSADVTFTARRIALNGSGLGILAPDGNSFIEVYDTSDPTKTANRLLQIPLSGGARNVVISRGIAYVADTSGLEVVNYLPFDNKGIPPQISISTSVASVDPNSLKVVEGTTIPIRANAFDDVQVRDVQLLVNGQLVRDAVSFPFDFFAIAPTVAQSGSTFTIQAIATDTGGNTMLSNVITIGLVRDTFPPTIVSFVPPSNSSQVETIQRVQVRFSKAMAGSTINAMTIRVRDTSGNYYMPTLVELRDNDRLAELAFAPLLTGSYQIVVSGSVTDRAGNALGADVVSAFTLTPRAFVSVSNANLNPNGTPFQLDEGTTIHGSIMVAAGVTVQSVVWLANGQVVGTSTSAPYTFSTIAPILSSGVSTINLVGQVTDTSGITTTTPVFSISLVRDTTPPTIVGTNPANGSVVNQGLTTILVTFSKSLLESTVTLSNFHLFEAGPSGVLGGADQIAIPISGLQFLMDDSQVQLTTAALAFGHYQLVVTKNGITDRPGNALGTGTFTSAFTVVPQLVQNGGFETGDFTGWTRSGNLSYTSISTFAPHSGKYHLDEGPIGSLGYIGQTLTTVVGQAYQVSLWYRRDGGTPSDLEVEWGAGNVVIRETNSPAHDYMQLSAIVMATSTSTLLRIGFRNDPGFDQIDDISVLPEGQPQFVAALSQAAAPAADIMPEALQPVVTRAIANLAAAGFNVSRLSQVNVRLAHLPGSLLGLTDQNTIWIDANAAGYGWYIDVSPSADAGFTRRTGANEFQALPGSPAYGHVDLLTVVTHELGHVLGFASMDPSVWGHDWMTATLGTGVRRYPDAIGGTNPVLSQPAGQPTPIGGLAASEQAAAEWSLPSSEVLAVDPAPAMPVLVVNGQWRGIAAVAGPFRHVQEVRSGDTSRSPADEARPRADTGAGSLGIPLEGAANAARRTSFRRSVADDVWLDAFRGLWSPFESVLDTRWEDGA
jgi:streptogramin lyase